MQGGNSVLNRWLSLTRFYGEQAAYGTRQYLQAGCA